MDNEEMIDIFMFDQDAGVMRKQRMSKQQFDQVNALQSLKEVEAAHIERVLFETGNNISWAARILNVDRRTLYRKGARKRGGK